ncbi:MAG: hypothetical protein JJU31_10645 [Wenzhouxiangella sp.]|nr:hypothetical protein [Wenzhouxiangella sp.]MCH8476474.1 hypothetical protein [Wenzhouxiangella sp.]
MTQTTVELNATITISGSQPPYQVDVPVVTNTRSEPDLPQPARITYTLAPASQSAGFSLGNVVPKTASDDIQLIEQSDTQYVFADADTQATEQYFFGFHYLKDGQSYYFDPEIDNEKPK